MRFVPLVLAVPALLSAASQDAAHPLTERYHASAAAADRAALIAAWRAEPALALPTIDQDLEGSLALLERSRAGGEAPSEQELQTLRERARFGASCADEAFGTRIFEDYAVAFASWDEDEQQRFRAGQAAFGRARAAAKTGDHAAALAAARECEALARPLGDWWGTAMGAGARAAAHAALGEHDQAVAAYLEASLLYHDLRLLGSEYRSLIGLGSALEAGGKKARAARALEAALALARTLGDEDGAKALAARLEALR